MCPSLSLFSVCEDSNSSSGRMSPASDRSCQLEPPIEMLEKVKLQALHTAVVSNGDEEPLTICGFKYSLPKTILTGILFALTAGLAWLLLYWMPRVRLLMTHDRCPLGEADTILVQVTLF